MRGRRSALIPLALLAGCAEADVYYYGFLSFLAAAVAWGALDLWGRRKK